MIRRTDRSEKHAGKGLIASAPSSSRGGVRSRMIELYVGQVVAPERIAARLTDFGYTARLRVTQRGEFRLQGEVLDVFPGDYDGPVRIAFDEDRIRWIASYNIPSGRSIWQHKMLMIRPHARPRIAGFTGDEEPLDAFVDLDVGDYVVHNVHGIGRYLGIRRMPSDPLERDHFVIEYRGGDRLFVPRHDMHLIQKYVGFNKRPPRLYKLGSREWDRVKAQIRRRLQRMAAELLRVQAVRAALKGYAFAPDTPWQKEFEARCPFRETPDQIKSIREVKADMESPRPMDRLLCGDVGFGKTEVALRAAFKAVMDGKQVLVLVPTTILAEQHHYNFTRRLADYPIRTAMLSRFRSRGEQVAIVRDLREGRIDIVIGTHRLLSKDVGFKALGLVIVDEEQRFGVAAKERIKHYRLLVDVLAMSATPIPRTLYMALSGAKDISVISTPPHERVPVVTRVIAFDEDLIRKAIARELRRGGQVFFLHNRIDDIDKIGSLIKKAFPETTVALGHGRMPSHRLEEVMLRFLQGEVRILVCTTIIESGIDIPNANTLIVNRADRFGLAELHQLRGRVGRSANRAYAYFIVPGKHMVSDAARSRLRALERYSELGAGFQIAFEDLQIRGAGNLLGREQSGYINAVGFDLYCRLLKQSVEHLKQEKEKEKIGA